MAANVQKTDPPVRRASVLAGKPVGHFFVFVAALHTARNNRLPQDSSAPVATGLARKPASPLISYTLVHVLENIFWKRSRATLVILSAARGSVATKGKPKDPEDASFAMPHQEVLARHKRHRRHTTSHHPIDVLA
ncbi:MAG TPA: hypothetical protein VIK39_00815 [Candidatus Angelobacter sp.]